MSFRTQDKQSSDSEEKTSFRRHFEPVLPEDFPQPVPARKGPKALRYIPVDLRRPVEEEPPEAAPAPQKMVLQKPKGRTFRIRKVEERRHAAG
jgi:hypothetical protein